MENRNPGRTAYASVVRIARGRYDYRAGISGTVAVTGTIKMWSAAAGGTSATMTIDGGNTITIPAGEAVTGEPDGTLVDPTFVFTGTTAYFVEFHT